MPCSMAAAPCLERRAVGQLDEPAGGHGHVLRVGAGHAGLRDPVADLDVGDARPDRGHGAGRLEARA